jgi:hypothetical protein
MKAPIALFVWALAVLPLAASAGGAAAASEKEPVLGPYRSEKLARAAARRLDHYGWSTRVLGRGCWYVHAQWTDEASAGNRQQPVPRGSAGQSIRAVSDLHDSDWQINAGRAHLWARARAGSTRPKR